MLDTVILQFKELEFSISDYSYFGTTKEIVKQTNGFAKWVNNPLANDRLQGLYMPRLTLIKRGYSLFLKIEFSAPKLLFKNNLDELQEEDFEDAIKTLQEKLRNMKVVIFSKHLEEAEVVSFHPSKNIVLVGGYTTSLAISELSKIDISQRFDFDEKNYRNNGQVLQFYTRSHSLVIYDKINDLSKPAKRAIDKDQTANQISLFELIKREAQRLEVLRIEVRLSRKKKMNEVLEKLGCSKNPQFKDIFNTNLCKQIVNLYWQDFFSSNLFVFNVNSDPQEILKIVLRKFPHIKIIKAINIVGLYMLCRDNDGIRGFRRLVDGYKRRTNWSAVRKYIDILENEVFTNQPWGFVNNIQNQLAEFKPFKLNEQVDM